MVLGAGRLATMLRIAPVLVGVVVIGLGTSVPELVRYAEQLGLDVDRFREDLRQHAGATRVADDPDSADLSGVSGTPTFFITGRRHQGAYDINTLSAAIKLARVNRTTG